MIGICPHGAAALRAAKVAEGLASKPVPRFHAAAAHVPKAPVASTLDVFDYEGFYNHELDKKHKDKSYRYFNNINRLAQEFPKAHMADKEARVTVWCSNDVSCDRITLLIR